MLNLDKKPCCLGKSMSINTEHHGDDDVGALDIPIDGIILNAAELDQLLGNGAHKSLYHYPQPKAGESSMPEARFPHLKPFAFKDHFERAKVTLELGMEPDRIMLAECTVRNVKLTMQAGGLTMMACSLRARPDSDDVALLFDHRNDDGTIRIEGAERVEPKGKRQQGDLPLGEDPGDDDGEQDEAA